MPQPINRPAAPKPPTPNTKPEILKQDVDIEDALEKGIHGLDHNVMKKPSDAGKSLFENQLQMRASNSHNRGDVGVDWSHEAPARNSYDTNNNLLNDRETLEPNGHGGMMHTAEQIQQLNQQIDRLSGGGMRT